MKMYTIIALFDCRNRKFWNYPRTRSSFHWFPEDSTRNSINLIRKVYYYVKEDSSSCIL